MSISARSGFPPDSVIIWKWWMFQWRPHAFKHEEDLENTSQSRPRKRRRRTTGRMDSGRIPCWFVFHRDRESVSVSGRHRPRSQGGVGTCECRHVSYSDRDGSRSHDLSWDYNIKLQWEQAERKRNMTSGWLNNSYVWSIRTWQRAPVSSTLNNMYLYFYILHILHILQYLIQTTRHDSKPSS